MKSKLTYILISGMIIFWVVFIGWGMLKTTFKLSQGKPPLSQLKATEAPGKTTIRKTPPLPTQESKSTPTPQAQAEGRLVLVKTTKVKMADFSDILPVMGTVKGKTEIQLKFEINGVIKKIYFREGEKIKQGELIATLDPTDAQTKLSYATNKVNAAQAAYLSAMKKLEVFQKLFEAGAVIKSKVEEAELDAESIKAQVGTAESEMRLAENEVNKTSLYAIKDGVMGPREAEEGEFVTPQDKIGSLLEVSEVYVDVGVVERDINKIKLGQKAKVYVDAHPGTAFEGVIDKIFPVVEGKSRTLTAKIKVPNPQGLLMPGMFSRVEISIVEFKDTLMVPIVALIQAGQGITLAPVISPQSIQKAEDESQTGVLELRRVTLGYATSDYAQITEGIKDGELIVTEAQGELKDKLRVKIIATEELTF